ncbi:hypothetical protein Mth01_11400 [Sphaerimonospora thailandensis]|uniref:Uncharacterized protein n=1 Tax=Sphaerimonospora thailandensis TaxID=795644 RepID=A0A8J3R4C7_9ACTN|nr:hypothetical protein Mth01_11400 [Sphaerimonospora thailandensis]
MSQTYGFRAHTGLGDHFHVVLGVQQGTEPGSYECLIVGEQDWDHLDSFAGSAASTGRRRQSRDTASPATRVHNRTFPCGS